MAFDVYVVPMPVAEYDFGEWWEDDLARTFGSKAAVKKGIRRVAPTVDVSAPDRWLIKDANSQIEIVVGPAAEVGGFLLRLEGRGPAWGIVGNILAEFRAQALVSSGGRFLGLMNTTAIYRCGPEGVMLSTRTD